MNRYFLNLVLQLCSIVSAQSTVGSLSGDHLAPIDPRWYPKFRLLVNSKLSRTNFDYGRVILRPASEGESSVSIYRTPNKPQTYRVTLLEAEKNLWQEAEGGVKPVKARPVRVRRRDADISESSAKLLADVWVKMLKETHSHEAEEQKSVPTDAPRIEFAIQRPLDNTLGEINQFVPHGTKIDRLINIVELLVSYCKASPQRQVQLERQIKDNARELLTEIQRDYHRGRI